MIGKYKQGQSRTSVGKKIYKITTTRVLYHLERLDHKYIQKEAKYLPRNDASWKVVADDYWQVKTVKQRYAKIGDICDDASEQNYLDAESEEFAISYFLEMQARPNDKVIITSGSSTSPVSGAGAGAGAGIGTTDPEARRIALDKDFPVCCPVDNCGWRY